MDIREITSELSVSPQISEADLENLAALGFKTVICNRPDGEAPDQVEAAKISDAAQSLGMAFVFMPVKAVTSAQGAEFVKTLEDYPQPALAYCRTGTRCATLWAMGNMPKMGREAVLNSTTHAGYDLSQVLPQSIDMAGAGSSLSAKVAEKKTASKPAAKKKNASSSAKSKAGATKTHSAASSVSKTKKNAPSEHHEIVIIGGGSAGIAVASSLLKRMETLDICIIEPSDKHYYQPGWTMVGGGVFQPGETERDEKDQMPAGVNWIKKSAARFEPENNQVILDDQSVVSYDRLILAAGLQLDWGKVKGLEESLGSNGVTSNYRFDLAPYTWELASKMKSGKAIFTQPPMPIKCAGAPQKAMYLSCSEWTRRGVMGDIQVDFCNAGGVLFGVADYVPALMEYVNKYGINLDFFYNLVEVDGKKKIATFEVNAPESKSKKVKMEFDMLHVCPPQSAPDFIKKSPFADDVGWVDVDQLSLQSKKFKNVWSLGDVMNAPNAKTAAAARKQAPVVAENIIADIKGKPAQAQYDGYGSCPLTVEHGKIVLAEFGYGGKLLPTFPKWVINGLKPQRRSWVLKKSILPKVYWGAMLEGREYYAAPSKAD